LTTTRSGSVEVTVLSVLNPFLTDLDPVAMDLDPFRSDFDPILADFDPLLPSDFDFFDPDPSLLSDDVDPQLLKRRFPVSRSSM
jgi:hypothetical protein